ncbi:hypothetical protein T265_04652 [Opisthorchis viverrini]|uniref:Uncharacterized protein n=1 Tax=Opisthorchis viverrini TaxID=6198 RepID=A0A074ZM93_OPIVI|nr:hypothetical protein T265_04652 [Opisthorchis viverrini]KER28513.1 hypothetical protein T265_04652 [Opisthorchis viverrini]
MWNPTESIASYCILRESRLAQYVNAFMAAHLVGQERAKDSEPVEKERTGTEVLDLDERQLTAVGSISLADSEQSGKKVSPVTPMQIVRIALPASGDAESDSEGKDIIRPQLSSENNEKLFIFADQYINASTESDFVSPAAVLSIGNRMDKENGDKLSDKKLSEALLRLQTSQPALRCGIGRSPIKNKLEAIEFQLQSMKAELKLVRTQHTEVKASLESEFISIIEKTQPKLVAECQKTFKDCYGTFGEQLKAKMKRREYLKVLTSFNLGAKFHQMEILKQRIRYAQSRVKRLYKKREKWQERSRLEVFKNWGLPRADLPRFKFWEHIADLEHIKKTELQSQDFLYALSLINPDLKFNNQSENICELIPFPMNCSMNLRLFLCLVALSEHTTGLDYILRYYENKTDTNALLRRVDKGRQLFRLAGGCDFIEEYKRILSPESDLAKYKPEPKLSTVSRRNFEAGLMDRKKRAVTHGYVHLRDLHTVLIAAGCGLLQTAQILHVLDPANLGEIDFITFLFYLPLFVKAHQLTVTHPLEVNL